MPTRLFICNTAGSGTRSSPYRSRISVLAMAAGETGVAIRQNLSGTLGHALVRLTASAGLLTSVAADAQVEPLPEIALDAAWNSWGTLAQRSALLSRLATRGFNTSGITGSTLFRVLVRRLGQRFEPAFSEDRF